MAKKKEEFPLMSLEDEMIPEEMPIKLPEEPLHSLDEDRPLEVGAQKPGNTDRIGKVGRIGAEEVTEALNILQEYKRGKANLENRIVANEEWYRLRHWGEIKTDKPNADPRPTSAWLFNSLANKHADAMDNYPEASVLPREEGDRASADMLSSILPVVLEQNDFECTYSDEWWQKLKTGTGVYGVFWDNKKLNGMGDISVRNIDLLNLFWEPGKKDIQQSRNVFHVELVDNDLLEETYPNLKGQLGQSSIDVTKYRYDDQVDTSKKSLVVDWYYKVTTTVETGLGVPKTTEVLHYCKFCNGEVLYASENDEVYASRGFYDHGKYPFVFDVMFPTEGTPAGFGYLDTMKDTQMYIDSLDSSILKYVYMMSHPRFFCRTDGGVNIDEFSDWSKTFINVNGQIDEDHLRQFKLDPLNALVVQIKNNKIEELKETSGNRDFSQGGTSSGVTAASAIAALQEAGNKLSRDMIKTSYRSYMQMCYLVIELIRQFYDEPRSFRILGDDGKERFVSYDNSGIAPVSQGNDFGLNLGDRLPIFDIKVRAHKANPFSKASQNQLALDLYGAGFFAPGNADQALACIEMMDFEGKQQMIGKISENGTLIQMVQQLQAQMQQMATIIDAQNGTTISQGLAEEQTLQEPKEKSTTDNITVSQNDALGKAVQSSRHTTDTTAAEKARNTTAPR